MLRRDIIQIDEEKCNGCGLCITGCHEGALALVDGKAKLISATYCDGLGACLPACPTGAITIAQREADEFVAPAPGSKAALEEQAKQVAAQRAAQAAPVQSELIQWPVQIKLVPIQAPYLQDARLLIAADCTAYARANFHADFMRGRVTLIGCPKLDAGSYAEKLAEIFRHNSIKSIMVVRMEVPCCGGLEHAVKQAILASGKMIPWQVVTLGTDGSILAD
ncbi:MAG TPA: ferredoxin [Clostridiales bacterium]|nr:ferredoxin [Clostridiales bacterium]